VSGLTIAARPRRRALVRPRSGILARPVLSLRALDALERRTVVLGVVALATVGAVAVGEVGRLWRRRVVAEDAVTTPEVIQKGAQAAVDTARVARRGYQETATGETVLFNLLSAFVISSSVVRLTTFGVRRGVPLLFNVRIGRRHIHHFVPGIALAFTAGSAGLFVADGRMRELLAIPLGIGMGLTFDESALLLELEDVYWSREGLLGVQITLGTASLLAAAMLALRILRQGEEKLVEEEGLPLL
jgi:hypothetical protein